jgi:hypothetical protein
MYYREQIINGVLYIQVTPDGEWHKAATQPKKKRRVISFDEKRHAVYQYYMTRDKSELCSLILALFYPKDLKAKYKALPKRFKL